MIGISNAVAFRTALSFVTARVFPEKEVKADMLAVVGGEPKTWWLEMRETRTNKGKASIKRCPARRPPLIATYSTLSG